MYVSTKTYSHDIGLSCAFRQWRADSHCRLIHGYALKFRFEFEADRLDARNWVIDFGSLKPLKAALEQQFDHKLLVAKDDPERKAFEQLARANLAAVQIVEATGCESFAKIAWMMATKFLVASEQYGRVRCRKVEVAEHGGNSAIYESEIFNSDLAVRGIKEGKV